MIQIRLLAVISVRTVPKQNKSQVSRRLSCRKTTKVFLQNVSWTRLRRSRNPWVSFRTLLLKSQTSLQNDKFPPILVTPWSTHKSTRGPIYKLNQDSRTFPTVTSLKAQMSTTDTANKLLILSDTSVRTRADFSTFSSYAEKNTHDKNVVNSVYTMY